MCGFFQVFQKSKPVGKFRFEPCLSMVKYCRSDYMRGSDSKLEARSNFSIFIELPTQWRRKKQGFRWGGGCFLLQNIDRILELVSQSECLKSLVDVEAYVEIANRDDKIFRNGVTSRFLCIADSKSHWGLSGSDLTDIKYVDR